MPAAVFLDRDGVINRDLQYVGRVEDFEFIDGVFEALTSLQSLGFLLIVVTNQSGIAAGRYTENDFHAVNQHMLGELRRRGVEITQVYYCPHSPDAGCACRKPEPGMILTAANDHPIDLAASWMIGDKTRDVEAGIGAGVGRTIQVQSGQPFDTGDSRATFVCDSITDTVDIIASHT